MPLTLHHPDGQVFTFDAGALCLELLVTGGEDMRAKYEVLHRPADFAIWAATSRLDLPGHGVDPAQVTVTAADLHHVKALREAVWFSAVRVAAAQRPLRGDIEAINAAASGAGVVPQLDGGRAVWRGPVTGGQLVTEIARDAVATFGGPGAGRIRQCANPVCALVYLDTSRPGARRWCSMQRCGNRSKVSGYRSRRREER
jgi:predicted RNA-binding Zn ribbon-like protein